MTSKVKQLSLLLLLFLLFYPLSSLQTHARKNYFSFNKITRTEDSTEAAALVPAPAPVVRNDKAAAALPPQSHHGYGLYARLADESLPTAMTNYYTELDGEGYVPSKFSNEEFNQERYESKEVWPNRHNVMSDAENGRRYYDADGERYDNRYESRSIPSDGYGSETGHEYQDAVDEFQKNYQDNQESPEEIVP